MGVVTRLMGGTLITAAALLITGCPPANDEVVDEPVVVDEEDPAGVPVCLLGEPFVASGEIQVRDAQPADAFRTGELRWQDYEGCERFVVDLVDEDGEPAERAGEVTAEVLRELAVVRLQLRDVELGDFDHTDATFDGPLARAAFVVSSPDGRWVWVDVHLGEPAEAFVTTLDEPARVILDLRPGGPAVPGPAPRENQVLVLEPRPGPASYPLTVTGYARTFEANVVVRLEQAGQDVFDDFTTATAWADAWGHYSFTIEEGPSGPVVLHVGEYSAKDGTWQGVAVELEMR